MEALTFKVSEKYSQCRLDKYLSSRFPFRSRSWWGKAISDGKIDLIDRPTKAATILKGGEICAIDPSIFSAHRHLFDGKKLNFVFHDEALVVLDKPAGLIVHRLNTLTSGALTCLLRERIHQDIHLVHRIDRLTSGLMVVALSKEASQNLDDQFRQGLVHKTYLALVEGTVPWDKEELNVLMGKEKGSHIRIKMVINPKEAGKHSHTEFKVHERLGDYTVVEAKLHTGRTHQIRLHLSHLGFPIVRDKLYGSKPELEYYEKGLANLTPFFPDWQGLHAWQLAFRHPITGKKMAFEAAPSGPMGDFIDRLHRRQQ